VELAQREVALPAAPQPPVPSQDVGRRPSLTKMVKRILEIRLAGDVFGTSAIAREINRHYGARWGGRSDVKQVSIILRRMEQAGRLRQVREGRPHHETLRQSLPARRRHFIDWHFSGRTGLKAVALSTDAEAISTRECHHIFCCLTSLTRAGR
jgi:hypothetical protein